MGVGGDGGGGEPYFRKDRFRGEGEVYTTCAYRAEVDRRPPQRRVDEEWSVQGLRWSLGHGSGAFGLGEKTPATSSTPRRSVHHVQNFRRQRLIYIPVYTFHGIISNINTLAVHLHEVLSGQIVIII